MSVEREWTHAGLDCAVLRVEGMGHLCGYVAVPESHPWHGLGYDDPAPNAKPLPDDAKVDDYGMAGMIAALFGTVEERATRIEMQVQVHGGITYAGSKLTGLDEAWRFGFDTAHAGDASSWDSSGRQWTVDGVVAETERMADQIASYHTLSQERP